MPSPGRVSVVLRSDYVAEVVPLLEIRSTRLVHQGILTHEENRCLSI